MIDWISFQSPTEVCPPTHWKNRPTLQVSRTVGAEPPTRAEATTRQLEVVNWLGRSEDCCTVSLASFDGTALFHPRSVNGGGRFLLPANIHGYTGR